MPESGFTWLDVAVLVAYFVGITLFGLYLTRRIKSSGGYFLGERKLPWWIMIGQAFSTGTRADLPVVQAGASSQYGFATIWYQWKNMLITPFYWLMSPWYRRSESTTVAEMVGQRYGSQLANVYTIFSLAFIICNQGTMLKGAGKIVAAATGGDFIDPNVVVLVMAAAFILYSFFGGLIATAYTEFVQSFLIIILAFMLIPAGLWVIGGFRGLHETLPPDFFRIYSEASQLDAFTIAMLTLNGLVGITAMPHMMSMHATGKSERSGRVGMTYGSMTKRFCTIGWAFTGLIVAALIIQKGVNLEDAEQAFGYACRELLGPGMLGLMVACLFAANMSGCSNMMVNAGALFTCNMYKPYVNPRATDRELMWTGRFSGLVLTGMGVVFALSVEQVIDAFLFTETIAAFMGIMFMGGVLWKRANRHGALAATLAAFAVYYVVNYRMVDELKLVYRWEAWPFAWAMLAGTAALIIVSLLTRAEDRTRIDTFFDNMQRSTDDENLPTGQPKPLAAERGQDMLLLDMPGWLTAERWRGFWRRYREDLIGFALAWLVVAGMILMAWGLVQIGK